MTDSEQGDPTSGGPPSGPGSRNHRRAAARERAQLARRRQKRRARGGRWAIQGGIAVIVLAVIVAVVLLVRQGAAPTGGAVPENMAGDGISIGAGFKAVRTDASASATPAPTGTSAADHVDIVVYLDYLCPICGSFEKTDSDYIRGLVRSGAATVTFHPIAILTSQSLGTKYSQRAANAAACVANSSPDAFFAFNSTMFARQPDEGTAGLTDPELVRLVRGVDGITNADRIAKCITNGTYDSWVVDATQRALSGPIEGASISKVKGTPTILVNGQQYRYSTPFTVEEFSNFVVTAAGNSYSDSATASPTPTPTPTPAPSSSASGSPVPGRSKIGTPAP